MKNISNDKQQKSLVKQLKFRLFLSVGLLIFVLLFYLVESIYGSVILYNLGRQKVSFHDNLNGMLTSMIDQETGLRGYIATNDPRFLEPLRSGRPAYLSYLQNLKDQTNSSNFSDTLDTLAQVQALSNDWYTNFAQMQIKNIQSGNLAAARSVNTNLQGKALFDKFRAALAQLQHELDHDLARLQTQISTLDWFSFLGVFVFSFLAVIILIFTFNRFVRTLHKQLSALKTTTSQLGSGDLSVRVLELTHQELIQLGQTFNTMADALQQQQIALKERDVLEGVLQLNSTLTSSLDLKALADEFLSKVLTLLDLHIGALYLYDTDRKKVTLFASQGSDYREIMKDFEIGEGTVGRTALDCTPLYLTRPTGYEVESFKIKTMQGVVLPASTYYLPLVSGNEPLGVLGVGSAFPMTEKARNVLNVVASNLSAALSNVRAYQRIQAQTEQLVERAREQESMNSELRRQRDELTLLNTALEEANRARSQFLSTMSHELRTPLTSIIGFTQILLSEAEKAANQRQKSNLERILKNGKHLLILINDVLDLAKIEAGRMDINASQVDLRELLSSVVEETQSIAIEQKIILRSSVEEGADSLETDPLKLRQILLNLISNALKFTEKGEVTVTATRVMSSSNGTKRIAIAVKDTGIGIAPEIQERIFEAFYQVDSGSTRKFGGTGLGLSIVRQLTMLLGGTLEIESSPGEGSTFTVILPIKVSEGELGQNIPPLHLLQQQVAPRLRLPSNELTSEALNELYAVSGKRETVSAEQQIVLAVDDNPDILALIKAALENTPFKVVGVEDPLKVMELVQELRPCAITLDVMMPNLNGWQILHQLKVDPASAHIPIVMLTILSERTTGYVLGADEYLIKPFKNDILLKTLQRLINGKHPSQDSTREMQQV